MVTIPLIGPPYYCGVRVSKATPPLDEGLGDTYKSPTYPDIPHSQGSDLPQWQRLQVLEKGDGRKRLSPPDMASRCNPVWLLPLV